NASWTASWASASLPRMRRVTARRRGRLSRTKRSYARLEPARRPARSSASSTDGARVSIRGPADRAVLIVSYYTRCPERNGGRGMADYLLYGANGYTGALIARLAVERGHRPLLAGRNAAAVASLAAELGLEHRVFGLDDPATLDAGLSGARTVLHCAGPFAHT